ncbi:hypothetical protein BDN71DRAFT_1477944 [Pleurotus eryngii]|uniref:Nucleolar protein 12 n=1 Tax=Pleurotus eryngii TaxID=5323 RepID=A0A9P5ZMA6_PLEER|nr:hypothetical protein BDN71DRAFT_1477944 [Pleurotus eryngii]
MSLSSVLIKVPGASKLDSELDALFQSMVTPVASKPPRSPLPAGEESSKKRTKSDAPSSQRKKAKLQHADPAVGTSAPSIGQEKGKGKGKGKKVKIVLPEEAEEVAEVPVCGEQDLSDASLGEADAPPVHESLRKGKKKIKTARQVNFVLPEETPTKRNMRTIFIGNLPLAVAQKKLYRKELQRHILSFVPSAHVESIRFRSIPFQTPTTILPDDDSKPSSSTPKKAPSDSKQPRDHTKDRTTAWRDRQDDEELQKDQKKFITPEQKKKIAFINNDFHSTADTMNAYLVFAHPIPAGSRSSSLPALPPCMDPYEAALLAAKEADGTTFMERVIRVDVAEKSSSSSLRETAGDPRLSIFVGNLDFASTEQDLRVYFEGVVATERGPPPESDKESTWVTRVRIVRDKDTQLGKGFAYVQFIDRECVDELLSMEEGKLRFAKRKLRVQRCKVLPNKSNPSSPSNKKGIKGNRPEPEPVVIPKGDPSLGVRIATLSKDERKKVKASSTYRVARRLAKKKARNALSAGGVKVVTKDRSRVRKPVKNGATDNKDKKRKGRIRSDNALAKRNAKK